MKFKRITESLLVSLLLFYPQVLHTVAGDAWLARIINNTDKDLLLAETQDNTILVLDEVFAGKTKIVNIRIPVTSDESNPSYTCTRRVLHVYDQNDNLVPQLFIKFTRLLEHPDSHGMCLVTAVASLETSRTRPSVWESSKSSEPLFRIRWGQEDQYSLSIVIAGEHYRDSVITVEKSVIDN